MISQRRKKPLVLISAVFAGILIGSPANAADIGKTIEEITALAKKEGEVRVASSWRGKIIKAIKKKFKDKYGIKVIQNRVRGLSSRERILNEAMAGLVEHDLVNVSGELHPLYIKAKVIVAQQWAKHFPDLNKDLISPDNYFVAAGFSRYGIVYNPKIVPANRVPKTWEDCLDPFWKGKLAVYTRPRTFTGIWPLWGKEKSIAYHKKIKAQNPVWVADQTGTVQKIAAGEFPFACGMPYQTLKIVWIRDPSASIKFVIPPQLPVHIGEAFAVMKGGKNPNAAILLAGFLGSEEGQSLYHLFGRSSPFVKGTFAQKVVQESGTKLVWGGWDFAGSKESAAAREIVKAWGFPKGKKWKKKKKKKKKKKSS